MLSLNLHGGQISTLYTVSLPKFVTHTSQEAPSTLSEQLKMPMRRRSMYLHKDRILFFGVNQIGYQVVETSGVFLRDDGSIRVFGDEDMMEDSSAMIQAH